MVHAVFAIFAIGLAAAQPVTSPAPQSSSVPATVDATWIAEHLPSRYNENLAGTTNTIDARYTPNGCTIGVALDFSWQFNSLGSPDRSKAFSVRGNAARGHHFNASDDGGTIDFSMVDPSSLHISDAVGYLGTEQVSPDSFEFTFASQTDAQAMIGAMTSFAQACAAHKS